MLSPLERWREKATTEPACKDRVFLLCGFVVAAIRREKSRLRRAKPPVSAVPAECANAASYIPERGA